MGVAVSCLLIDITRMFFFHVVLVESRLSFSQLLPMMPMALGVSSTKSMTSLLVLVATMLGLLMGLPFNSESTHQRTVLDLGLSNTT